MSTLVLCFVLGQPVAAIGPPAAPPPASIELPPAGEEVGFVVEQVRWIKAKIESKEYGPATGAIIMLLFAIAHLVMLRLGKKIRSVWYGHLAMATGIAVGLSAELSGLQAGAGVWDWACAVLQGAAIGLTAVGAWSYFGKKIFGKWLKKADAAGNGG